MKKKVIFLLLTFSSLIFTACLVYFTDPMQTVKVVSVTSLLRKGMSKHDVTTLLDEYGVAFTESTHSSGEVSITIGRDGFLESLKPNRLTYLQFNSEDKLVRASGQVIYGVDEGRGYEISLK